MKKESTLEKKHFCKRASLPTWEGTEYVYGSRRAVLYYVSEQIIFRALFRL